MQNIKSITFENGVSKTGNPFKRMVIEFNNGYKFRCFVNEEQFYLISLALEK